jgi:predicted PurR-regulated permease PerM
MNNNGGTVKLPVYARLAVLLVGLIAFFFILAVGKTILVPLLFALLLAMLLDPLVARLHGKGLNRVVAITLVVLGAMALLGALAYFITDQVMRFSESMDDFKSNLRELAEQVKGWVQEKLNMERRQVDAALATVKDETMSKGGSIVGTTVTTVGALFAFFFLLPVYTFLFLLYKQLLFAVHRPALPRKPAPHGDRGAGGVEGGDPAIPAGPAAGSRRWWPRSTSAGSSSSGSNTRCCWASSAPC